eukprot:1394425-Rhodomonas_salina.3
MRTGTRKGKENYWRKRKRQRMRMDGSRKAAWALGHLDGVCATVNEVAVEEELVTRPRPACHFENLSSFRRNPRKLERSALFYVVDLGRVKQHDEAGLSAGPHGWSKRSGRAPNRGRGALRGCRRRR